MRHNIAKKLAKYSNSPNALLVLFIMSFLESCISPLSPLILLIPMCVANPKKSWYFVLVATVAATLGSVVGYYLGYFSMDFIQPVLINWGYGATLLAATQWLHKWGLWCLFVASIFPIPYKLFAIASGASEINFIAFISTSLLVRFIHFALVPLSILFFKETVMKWFYHKVD